MIRLVGPVDEVAAHELVGHMLFARKMGFYSELVLEIDSPGGEINPGLAVFETLAETQPRPLTIGVNLVSGTALLLLAGGRRGHRMVRSNALLSFAPVTAVHPEADVTSVRSTLVGLLSRNSGMTAAEVEERMSAGAPLSTTEAVVLGIADRVDDDFQIPAAGRD